MDDSQQRRYTWHPSIMDRLFSNYRWYRRWHGGTWYLYYLSGVPCYGEFWNRDENWAGSLTYVIRLGRVEAYGIR